MAEDRRRHRRRSRRPTSISWRDVIVSSAILVTPFAVILVNNPQNIKAIFVCAAYVLSAIVIWNIGWMHPYNRVVRKFCQYRAMIILMLSVVFVGVMTSGLINFDAPQTITS